MTTIKFHGASDDLLIAEFDQTEVSTVGQVQEINASAGGWLVTYPADPIWGSGGPPRFAVVGEFTDRGHWRMSIDFAPGCDEDGDGPMLPEDIDAGVGRRRDAPYSTYLALVVPLGTTIEQLPSDQDT